MMCPFCKQDVDNPCGSTGQMEQRAADHVERCEKALRDGAGTGGSADVQGGGRH